MNRPDIYDILLEIKAFLEKYQDTTWTDYFTALIRRFDKEYLSGNRRSQAGYLEDISILFGGMGSFNDLTINSESGHAVSDIYEEGVATRKLRELKEKLYQALQIELAKPR